MTGIICIFQEIYVHLDCQTSETVHNILLVSLESVVFPLIPDIGHLFILFISFERGLQFFFFELLKESAFGLIKLFSITFSFQCH